MENTDVQGVIHCEGDGSEVQTVLNRIEQVVEDINREYERVIQLVRMDFEAGEM